MSSTATISLPNQTMPKFKVKVEARKRKNRTKRTTKSRPRKQRPNTTDKNCYAKLLNYPFDSAPCRLGWGTMVPTQLGTMAYRATLQCFTDGAMAVFVMPTIGINGSTSAAIQANLAGAGSTTWSPAAWLNISQYPAQVMENCRIISVGLRVTPLVAATAAPGICFAGSIAGLTRTEMVALTPTTLQSQSSLSSFVTNNNQIVACSRPLDNQSYEFLIVNSTGSLTNSFSTSIPVVSLTGYPASSNILVEAILHFEYIPITNVNVERTNNSDYTTEEPKISNSFPSLEQMWRYTSTQLNPSAFLDTSSKVFNILAANSIRRSLRGRQQQQQRLL